MRSVALILYAAVILGAAMSELAFVIVMVGAYALLAWLRS